MALQWALTMIYAIDEINRNITLLPNVALGYAIHDSCFSEPNTVLTSLQYVEKDPKSKSPCYYQAVIGTYGSTLTAIMAELLGIFYIPQVS